MASDTYDPCGHVCFRCGQCPDCCPGHDTGLVRPRTAPLTAVRPQPALRLVTSVWRLPRRIVHVVADGTDRLVDELAYGMWR